MDEGDAATKAEKAAAADFKGFEAKQGELIKSLEARKAELEAQLAGVEGRRKDLMGAVPAELSDRYDKTRVRRNGVGLSKLEGNLCTDASLPPQVVNVKRGTPGSAPPASASSTTSPRASAAEGEGFHRRGQPRYPARPRPAST
jgi:hypothetical protein